VRQFLKIIIGMSFILALSACSSKSDSQKAVDDANRSVDQAKRDADKAREDAKKATDDAAKAAAKGNEASLDATSAGGQPGAVSLAGGWAGDKDTLDNRISVKLTTGKGWRGLRPKVNSGILQLKNKISDSAVQEIEKLKNDKTFVNFGCDISARNEVEGLEERQAESTSSTISVIKAKVVLICNGSQLKGNMTLITADTVILVGLSWEMIGAADKSLSIIANDLNVDGENSISSKGKDGASTLIQGPLVSISAARLSGIGKLEINAEGSSYQVETK
jgi:outer membrane murein-binding lipoprotein Lpp